ncbi:hypothetical protein U1Q18_045857 [Sarracenia purpurea var. burkii]
MTLDATLATFDGVFEKSKSRVAQNKADPILFLDDEEKEEASEDDEVLLRAYVGEVCLQAGIHNIRGKLIRGSNFARIPTLIQWQDEAIKGCLEDREVLT